MAYEFKLPDLGEGLTEGEIARWFVSEGQEVGEDDPLVEIQTDKTTVEIPSPAAGTVARILASEGDVVPVGTVIVVIGDGDAARAAPVDEEQPRAEQAPQQEAAAPSDRLLQGPSERVRATPLVRRLARELGVDLAAVAGTGPQGRITEEDVRAAAGAGVVPPADGEGRREPIRGVRRLMLENMTRAREIPAVTWVEECDFTDVDLGLLVPRVLRACAEALKKFPELNARIEDGELVLLDRYDIGVAVATDDGLVVPVVRDCGSASLEQLDAEVKRLADAARTGRLAREDLQDGTFTITSGQVRRPRRHAAPQPAADGNPRGAPDRRAAGRP
jgi:pyruvate dehydrogenase E2 component (dihydrolipoamide acetyltransferase)